MLWSSAPAARRSKPVPRSRKSTWKSARNVIHFLPASRNSWTPPAASKDSTESTPRIKRFPEPMSLFRYFHHFVLTATNWALSSSDDEILVGGQAVIEGVMMRSPKGYSVAVRRQDGTIRVMKDALLSLGEKWRVVKAPVLRGVGVLGQALVLGIRALRFSAEEALTGDGTKKQVEVKVKQPPQVSSWLKTSA